MIRLSKTVKKKGYSLYDFQEENILYFKNSPSKVKYLADDMGLGKTIQCIVYANTTLARNVLVVCPSVALYNWIKEINLWYSLSNGKFKATAVNSKSIQFPRASRMIGTPVFPSPMVVSYDMITRNKPVKDYLLSREWDLIIYDEAHMLKTPDALRTIYFRKDFLPNAKDVILASGTPMLNGAHELYVPVHAALHNMPKDYQIVGEGALSAVGKVVEGYEAFSEAYAKFYQGKYGPVYFETSKHFPDLKSLIKQLDFFVRHNKEEVLHDLPSKDYRSERINISAADCLDPEVSEGILKILDIKDQGLDLESLPATTLRNMAGITTSDLRAWRRHLGVLKANSKPFVNFINDTFLNQKVPVLIFCWHRDVVQILRRVFEKAKPSVVVGGLSSAEKDKQTNRFQNGQTDLFIGNIRAAGTAITLTRAFNVVMLEWTGSPLINEQAIDRVYRIGQENAVMAHFIVSDCPADTKLANRIVSTHKNLEGKLDGIYDGK